ncbi:protein kinase [Streptomyces actuosus]|uniref:non-specific serine/threonine protein kinase n=1 Tax=Streptomyces actuosus TaxID=1885 RepID=A0ABS2VLA1_STRAS|nr:protein kinase [Streptomyces actuosus]MBN0043821.1 protein kinase [Streptomyces actuosus]
MADVPVPADELIAGRYRLLRVVHRETNRVCWSGEDVEAGRPCLVTRTGLPTGPDTPHEEGARRITGRVLRMAETMVRLCPGRIPVVVDAIVAEGGLWTVTEAVDGPALGEILGERVGFHPVRAARIGLEILDVLQAAHDEGITHGELSPGQVFVREHGPVLVAGFGLAGATLAPRMAAPSYASPEQARDERIGPAADLWALGAILYTMVEGRPPFRDRDRPETTLRGVDRLPLRAPVRAGPLTQTVRGLLRKNSRERLTRTAVREALTRVLNEDEAPPEAPVPRLRRAYRAVTRPGRTGRGRAMAFGTALAVVTVAAAVLAATVHTPGGTVAEPPPRRPAAPSAPVRPSTKSPASPTTPPAGFRTYAAPEGFSVALPDTWRRLRTTRVSDLAYRVVFGADDDPRTLAVTYSERVGPDPVAVWREDVEPGLKKAGGYRRIGEIRATTYQDHAAADMQWIASVDGEQVRTFGRGFLVGGGRGYSLRFTAPAAEWTGAAERQALDTALRTFRPPSG